MSREIPDGPDVFLRSRRPSSAVVVELEGNRTKTYPYPVPTGAQFCAYQQA